LREAPASQPAGLRGSVARAGGRRGPPRRGGGGRKGAAHAAASVRRRSGLGGGSAGGTGSPSAPAGGSGALASGGGADARRTGRPGPRPSGRQSGGRGPRAPGPRRHRGPGGGDRLVGAALRVEIREVERGQDVGCRRFVGTRTTSSASVPSKSFPGAACASASAGSPGSRRAPRATGSPRISGQLPEPVSSTVHVTGSPALTSRGTTFEVILKSPTAPVNPAGAGGSGRTSIDTGAVRHRELLVLALLEEAEAGDADAQVDQLAGRVEADRGPAAGAIARVW
jgi:hypothetical protein